ncbi:histidinol-phosphatase [Sulfuriroseicoccus oceanibius]|nr:histidinol-phosphatase [Sulfuriroseicoccus oceanibius]
MMQLTDYHTHNTLCHHAEGTPTDYALAAVERGLAEYGASDHNPSPTIHDDWRMEMDKLDLYIESVRAAADAVAKVAPAEFKVKLGMECDFLVGEEPWLDQLAAYADWDYLIGSVHYIDREWAIDDPRLASRISANGTEETWQRYWDCYVAMIRSKRFDILGHPDLVKKFGDVPGGDLDRFFVPVIEAMVEADVCFEINTAGWHKECAEQYPHQRFLELAGEAGLPIVISSDAHAPSEIGRDFERALELAKRSGIRHLARFTKRERSLIEIA